MKNNNWLKPISITGVFLAAFLVLATFTSPVKGQFNSPSPTPAYTVSTNVGAQSSLGYATLLTNAAKVSQVQIAAGANTAVIDLYDNNITNFNYTNTQYVTLTNYLSNVVYTSISPLTGVTNTFTNSQLVTASITNVANTNQIPYRTFVAAANTLATYTVDMIMTKGISFRYNASTNVTVLVTYRPND